MNIIVNKTLVKDACACIEWWI